MNKQVEEMSKKLEVTTNALTKNVIINILIRYHLKLFPSRFRVADLYHKIVNKTRKGFNLATKSQE